MDDQLRPIGSRWEPTSGPTPYWSAAEPPVPPYGPAYGDGPTDRARWPVAGRGPLAALAAGLVLVSGVGGFAVGRAVAGNTGQGLGGHDLSDDLRGGDLDGPGRPGRFEGSVPPGLAADRPGTVPPAPDDQGGGGATI